MSRSWSLLMVCLIAGPAAAQDRPSHRSTNSGIDGTEDPQSLLTDRLGSPEIKRLADLLKQDEGLRKDMAKLASTMLKDRKFVQSLRGKFERGELDALRRQFADTRVRPDFKDPGLKKLVQELKGSGAEKLLNPEQRKLVEQWQQRVGPKQPAHPTPPNHPPPPPTPEGARPPTPPPAAVQPPPPPPSNWMNRQLKGLTKEAEAFTRSNTGKSMIGWLKGLSDSDSSGGRFASGLARRASGLRKYLPSISGAIPRGAMSSLPRPRLSGLSAGLPTPRSALDSGKWVLLAAALGGLGFLAWRGLGWYQQRQARLAAEWRLGPWPVQPRQVSTREQLVAAFEHLALFLLGRQARSYSHKDVAGEVGGAPARELAAAYEKARYAPPADEMSAEEIARARKHLCDLAGAA